MECQSVVVLGRRKDAEIDWTAGESHVDGSPFFALPSASTCLLEPTPTHVADSILLPRVAPLVIFDAAQTAVADGRMREPAPSGRRNRTAEFGQALAELW